MLDDSVIMGPISGYLIAKIPEISFLLSSILMIFAGDYVMENFIIKRMKKQNFFTRTLLFLLYALLIFPTLTTGGAFLLRAAVLYPLKESIILVLAISFVTVGVFLSIRYSMKLRWKPR